MLRRVVFAQVLARPVEAGFHGGDADVEDVGDFRVAAAFLHEREQGAILRAELREGVAQRVELLGVHRAGRLGDVLMLLAERQEIRRSFCRRSWSMQVLRARRNSHDSNCAGAWSRSIARTILMKTCCARSST